MTKSNLLFGAAIALAAGMLAGCSKEPAAENQIQTVDRDQVRYLNVTISSPTGPQTRAGEGDFKPGTTAENFVDKMTFVFYDAAGLPTGQVHTLEFKANEAGENKTEDGFETKPGNVGKIWTSTVPVQLNQGENLPSYVMCFINPAVSTADFQNSSMEAIKKLERQTVVNTNGHFPMSNSVYYGTNPITGQSNVRMYATPIITDQLYATEDDAKNGTATEIYVERYAASIKLNLSAETVKANTDAVNGYTLTFVPEHWRVNATDQNTYAIKRYGLVTGTSPNTTVNYEPVYSDLLDNFEGKTWWNDANNYRSYWACTPSYYTNDYPRVSDDITDKAKNNDYTGDTDATKYPYDIHYFNYSQFVDGEIDSKSEDGEKTTVKFRNAIPWSTTDGFNAVFYSRETTTASSAWGYEREAQNADDQTDAQAVKLSYNPLATIASAVIIGHYTLTRTDETKPAVPEKTTDGEPTFYLFGKTNGKHNLYFDDKTNGIRPAMIAMQNVVLQSTTDGYISYRPTGSAADIFTVDHPSKAVRDLAKVSVAGRLVALQIKEGATLPDNLYYYDATKGDGQKYVKITAAEINKVNSDLLSVGYASKYGNGISYFNIPIEHLGIYATATGETGTYVAGAKVEGKYNFEKCPAGSFGIVRNHAYTINVTGISGLGTALRDKNQPIVPPVDETTYYISAKVNILNWRIVPAQSVTL